MTPQICLHADCATPSRINQILDIDLDLSELPRTVKRFFGTDVLAQKSSEPSFPRIFLATRAVSGTSTLKAMRSPVHDPMLFVLVPYVFVKPQYQRVFEGVVCISYLKL